VKFAEIKGITGGENLKPLHIDSEVLKCGDQMGFVTPVVHTLTYGNRSFEKPWICLTSLSFFIFKLCCYKGDFKSWFQFKIYEIFNFGVRHILIGLKLTRKFPTWRVMLQNRKSKELTVIFISCGSYELIWFNALNLTNFRDHF